MGMQYLIGIDLGTSGTNTVLFDQNGGVVASAAREYALYQPQNGWAEQSPDDWWEACVATLRQVIRESGIDSKRIAGVGISGQMHGLVMLDKNGEILRNSIIWCDGRTSEECAEITERIGSQRLIAITANPALTGFTAGKILWVRKHEPVLFAKCRHILLPKDYLRYKLTGVFATEVSDASGMNLMDISNRTWSDEILSELALDRELLAKMHESIDITGEVTAEAASLTGLAAGTPVVGGAGDNAAAAIGTGVVSGGKAVTTIGTSGVIFAHSEKCTIDPLGRVHTFCAAVPGAWTVMSCTLFAGGSLKWYRDNFCAPEIALAESLGKDPYHLMDEQAERVPIGANRLLFLPYLMGERSPLLNPNARGVFFGLSAIHTRQDLLRAVMEGVVYSQLECLDVLRGMGVTLTQMMTTGGGGTSPLWRQMLADAYNCPVTTVENEEGAALGAAILAGVGTGAFPSVSEACNRVVKQRSPQNPLPQNTREYEKFSALYRKIFPQLKSSFDELVLL
jgi:xylulokinase